MANASAQGKLNARAVATFVVLLCTIALLVSGTVLYFHPAWARVPGLYRAFWVDWHIGLSLMFLIAAGVHLACNWKALLCYLGRASNRALARRREAAVALALFVALTAAVGMRLLPFEAHKGHGPGARHGGPMPPAAAVQDAD